MKREKRKKKKGVGKGKREVFIILCAIFSFLFPTLGLLAQEEETVEYEPIEVRLETNPANPTVNNPWSVFILVNHPRTDEVSVDSPDFPSSLALERIRTETRTILGTNSQSERWTRVEFLFTPRRVETFRLEPFEIRIHERLALTEGINVRVQGETAARYEPRFRWLAPPAGLRLGETGEITLELTNWDPARRIPEDFFRGRAPLNVILEENPPVRMAATAAASAVSVYRYTILLIPLDHSSVKLEAFSFYSDTYTLNVPEINLQVLSARQAAASSSDTVAAMAPALNETHRDEIPDEINPVLVPVDFVEALSFPQEREDIFFLWRRKYREIIVRVEALWETNQRAEALAEIRKNERDSPVGPSLVPVRREMEARAGLGVTEDEIWRPFGISLFSFVVLCLVLVFAGLLMIAFRLRFKAPSEREQDWNFRDSGTESWGKNVTSRRRYGFILIIVSTFIVGLIFILPDWKQGFFPVTNSVRSGRIAVLKRTQSYRVPDYKGAVNDWFSEGQPATMGDFRGDWCFAETLDGRSGWVERESVINY